MKVVFAEIHSCISLAIKNDCIQIITIEYEKYKHGCRAYIRNLGIPVKDILKLLGEGITIEQVLTDFPELTHDDIKACFAYAAEKV